MSIFNKIMKMENQKCNHKWEEKGNKIICKYCNKQHLKLEETGKVGLRIGVRDNGKKYSVRDTRNKYFYPEEWLKFISSINNSTNKMIFETLIITGARIQECLMIKRSHLRLDRKYLTLYTTKIKAKRKETKPKPRDITLSKSYIRKLKKFINENNIKEDDFLFINPKNNPKQTARNKSNAIYKLFKRTLKKIGMDDYYQYSLHNIRKTHGLWLKSLNINSVEICQRLGHTTDTYLKHYGSTDVFQPVNRKKMVDILGDIYGLC